MENGSYLPRLPLALHLSELFHLPIEAVFSSPTSEYLA
jgi:DNA-binding XRE family transcriptional regulator